MSERLYKLVGSCTRLYVIATGAGAGIQQAIWSIPGCSSFFVGASFPYEGSQTEELLGFKPENFCSKETAIDLAMAAFMRACNGDSNKKPVGLGLTASVASLRAHRGEHRIFAAVATRESVWVSAITLPKEGENARERDGRLADELGLKLIGHATGMHNIDCEEVTLESRKRFLSRSYFNSGTRHGIPSGCLTLFPGAFNPPHAGHFANADNSGKDTIFHITANPPHKEPLSLGDMLERAGHFKNHHRVLFTENDPLYLDKARRFPGSTLILGTDALARMLDPKWGHDVEPMLSEFKSLNIHFLVAPRGGSISVREILAQIPAAFFDMFLELPATPYSCLSSTAIRNAK